MSVKNDIIRPLINSLPIAIAVLEVNKQGKPTLKVGNTAFKTLWNLEEVFFVKETTISEFVEYLRDQRLLPEQTDFAKFRSHINTLALSDSVSTEDWHLPDGSAFRIKFFPLDAEQRLFIVEDLTPGLALERIFNESTHSHQITLNHLQEGLALFGSDGFLRFHNSAFAKIWEIPVDALSTDTHVTAFLDATRKILPVKENWPERREKLSGRLLSRKSRVIQIRCNNGMVLEAANIPSPDGTVLLRYADITDSVKLEDTLRNRAKEVGEYAELIAAANRLKSEFLANLSHEIKAPLNDINGLAELLSGNYFGKLNQRQQEYADGIRDETGALLGLVSDIMDLSAIEAGSLECNLEIIDLHAILVEILRLVGERTRQKKIMLRFECPIDIGLINADQKKFKQCVLHLLGNAITYSGSGGKILITANRNKKGVVIEIRDTGIGIPKADLERVFIGFESGNLVDSIKKGTGLGLTLVRALIELQGGTINIRSKPNQGTIVSLFLPENSVN